MSDFDFDERGLDTRALRVLALATVAWTLLGIVLYQTGIL